MYDMFVIASKSPLQVNTQETIEQALMSTPGGRLVLALLDKNEECKNLNARLQESDSDRAARLDQIYQYDAWLKESRDRATELQTRLARFDRSFVYKVGRRLGLF
jgi:hypothetical protein